MNKKIVDLTLPVFTDLPVVPGTTRRVKIEPDMTYREILELIGPDYHHVIDEQDSIPTIERKLKAHLENRILTSIRNGNYEQEVRDLKRRVNGQWDVERVVDKGNKWAKKQKDIDDN